METKQDKTSYSIQSIIDHIYVLMKMFTRGYLELKKKPYRTNYV